MYDMIMSPYGSEVKAVSVDHIGTSMAPPPSDVHSDKCTPTESNLSECGADTEWIGAGDGGVLRAMWCVTFVLVAYALIRCIGQVIRSLGVRGE